MQRFRSVLAVMTAGCFLSSVLPCATAQQPSPSITSATQPSASSPDTRLPVAPLPVARAPVAADPRLGQVLGIPSSYCGHVIDLLMTNRQRQNAGIQGADFRSGAFFGPGGAAMTPGDLELLDVHLVSDASAVCGPTIQLTFRNVGSWPVGHFRITAVTVLGTIHVHSPSVSTMVSRIDAGATVQLQMQLPTEAMSMSLSGQPACPFDTLVVALDSFDELVECNELNNILIRRREEIVPLAVETGAETVEVPATPAPSSDNPDGPAAPGAATAPDSPEDPLESSPLDSIDLDDLVSGGATSAATRLR